MISMLTKNTVKARGFQQAQTTIRLANILVPIDFSPESKSALRYAAAFARQFGAALTLVHVVKPIVCSADFGYGPVNRCSPDKNLLKKAKARLGRLEKSLSSSGLKTSFSLRTGGIESEIVETARDLKIDLIIMGTRGECGKGVTIDSTAEKIVHHAPCPVFVVRRKEHELLHCCE